MKIFFETIKKNFYWHGSIWDIFIKKFFLVSFLQIRGSSWDTFIKKISSQL